VIRSVLVPFAIASCLVAVIGIAAADGHHGAPPRRPHRPPPEAVAACKDKHSGDACTVQLRDRSIDGVCKAPPDADGDGTLACMPEHPPGPPPEAIEACSGKSVGDACTVDFAGHSVDGTCRSVPDGGPLACAPSR
jgi:hypothetical protein